MNAKSKTVAGAQEAAGQEAVARLDAMYEFDREPVTPDRFEPGRHFAGNFAGEHVAATEFVIGALFVSWGAAVPDILFGLLLGNLLAVLSWTLVCAPIAVDTRLTLYWYLRKIAGPGVTLLYNVLNATLYCVLAGAMITVSASAVRLPFGIAPQTGWIPQDLRFVLVVLVVGAVVVTLAILGFKRLAQFASVTAPWLLLMFVAGALVLLPRLAASVPEIGTLHSLGDFWRLAKAAVWTGTPATPGTPALGFWHVAAFAWIANLAMHLGLSDMALFRYAKKASYGLYSAIGMFMGHYLAWVAAGIMGAGAALLLRTPLIQLDAGAVAFAALGVAGAVAVVIAGWTTSNPTLYRAGLAFQAVSPGWPRWVVTLIAGALTTLIACSPFVFTRLLDFVGVYGLLLVPIGTIVVVEHWLFPRMGFTRYWASRRGQRWNVPALASWGIAIAVAVILWQTGTVHLFFLLVPTWILTALLYISLAAWAGARQPADALGPAPIETAAETATPAANEPPAAAQRPTLIAAPIPAWVWALGVIAVGALVACFVLPLRFFLGGGANYTARVATLQTTLAWVSLVYFASGTAWAYLKERYTGEF